MEICLILQVPLSFLRKMQAPDVLLRSEITFLACLVLDLRVVCAGSKREKVGTRSSSPWNRDLLLSCEFVCVKRIILLVLASDVLETENSFKMFGPYGTSTSDGDTTLSLCYRASYHITISIRRAIGLQLSEMTSRHGCRSRQRSELALTDFSVFHI